MYNSLTKPFRANSFQDRLYPTEYAMGHHGNAFTSFGAPAGAVGGWVELDRTTLGADATTINVSGLPDKRYYMILSDSLGYDASMGANPIQFNADIGTNYAQREEQNGQADTTDVSDDEIVTFGTTDSPIFSVGYLANLSAEEKLLQWFLVHSGDSASATNPPFRQQGVAKWANTAEPFDEYNWDTGNASKYLSGSEVVVLGWDPADVHTTNFWEELASADLSGGADPTLSTGTFTAKRYLWVQFYCSLASAGTIIVRFNNNSTTTNYAIRTNTNGGADGTNANRGKWDVWSASNTTVPMLVNMFIVNNGSSEALGQWHTVLQGTSGSANAPQRQEGVGKFVPTTQITEIDVTEFNSVINLNTISQIKVWGAN